MFVHHMRAPLGRRHPDHNKYAVVLEAIKAKPVGGRPMGGAPSLDRSCARRPLSVCGSGRRNGCPGRTKKLKDEKMDRNPWGTPLTKSAP